jgi:hypothetical protein
MAVVIVVAFYSCHNPHEAGAPRDAKLPLFLLKALLQPSPLILNFSSLHRQVAVKVCQESAR